MQVARSIMDFIVHINVYLEQLVTSLGAGVYIVMFLVVFAETGLVVTPFLPGDSLLFAAGALAAKIVTATGQPVLNVWLCCIVFVLAAFIGDNVNYWFGHFLGPRMLKNENSRIFRKSYLDKTREFFDHYGSRAVIMARFVPIVRTFAPFMAGVGHMPYGRYISFSFVGTVMWVGVFVAAGYFFGNIPAVQENFTLAILAMIAISLLPALYHWASHKLAAARAGAAASGTNGDDAE